MDNRTGSGTFHCMESVSDNLDYASHLLVDLASAPSIEDLLKMLASRAGERPNIISLQIWLVHKTDGSL